MKLQFEYNRITRERILGAIEGLSVEQMIAVPEGFGNNVLWNFGHILITQHLLCFKLADKEPSIPNELIESYRKGSNAAAITEPQKDLDYFKANVNKLIDLTEEAYEDGQLAGFNEYTTSYGVTLNSVEEAISFNNLHEALHLGYIMAMKKCI